MYEQNTSMMNAPEKNAFLLPAMVEGDFSSEEIAEDADGLQMMSFQRVKIPAGGALQFEIPTEDPDNPDYARTLEGVILYNHSAYTLWPEGSEYDEDTKPLCSSVDGKTGIGDNEIIGPAAYPAVFQIEDMPSYPAVSVKRRDEIQAIYRDDSRPGISSEPAGKIARQPEIDIRRTAGHIRPHRMPYTGNGPGYMKRQRATRKGIPF